LTAEVRLLVTKGTEIMGAARHQHQAGAAFLPARWRGKDTEELASEALPFVVGQVDEDFIEAVPDDESVPVSDEVEDVAERWALLARTTSPAFLENQLDDLVQYQVLATAADVAEIEIDRKRYGRVVFAPIEELAREGFARGGFAQSRFPEQDAVG